MGVKSEKRFLTHAIRNEGFSYCFTSYSHWENIKDEGFQKLLKRYVSSERRLRAYIHSMAGDYCGCVCCTPGRDVWGVAMNVKNTRQRRRRI